MTNVECIFVAKFSYEIYERTTGMIQCVIIIMPCQFKIIGIEKYLLRVYLVFEHIVASKSATVKTAANMRFYLNNLL